MRFFVCVLALIAAVASAAPASPKARVAVRGGVPILLINEQPVPPLVFFFNIEGHPQLDQIEAQVRLARAQGIHIYSFPVPSREPWGDAFNDADQTLRRFLKADPDAVFIVRLRTNPPRNWSGWATAPQSDLIRFSDGTSVKDVNGSAERQSLASDFFHRTAMEEIRKFIRHYEGTDLGERIIAYHITGQNTGEWFPQLYRQKGLDYSPVNQARFRAWLRGKYGSDAGLSKAWGRSVTLASDLIPLAEPGRFPIRGAWDGSDIVSFYDFKTQRDWIDFSEYESELVSGRILDFAKVVKEESHGRALSLFFYGYTFNLPGSMSGHLETMRLLESPLIDGLCAPISYYHREAGSAASFMQAVDSVTAHGKLILSEDDQLSFLKEKRGAQWKMNIQARNAASAVIHRAGTWWMDLFGTGVYSDASIWPAMGTALSAARSIYSDPHPYAPEVAVIADDTSKRYLRSDWNVFSDSLPDTRDNISKAGVTAGFYLLDDFINGMVPPAKVYVFANTFYLTDERLGAIRTRLEKQHATALWQYAPGYLTPAGPSTYAVEKLTGIHVEQVDGRLGSSGAGALQGLNWGASGRGNYSPRLVIRDPGVVILGRFVHGGEVSTARKSTGGFTSILCTDFARSPAFFRGVFRAAGVHVWLDTDDVVMADRSFLVVHVKEAGVKRISLPEGIAAVPLLGSIAASTDVLFSSGETRWFRLVHSGVR